MKTEESKKSKTLGGLGIIATTLIFVLLVIITSAVIDQKEQLTSIHAGLAQLENRVKFLGVQTRVSGVKARMSNHAKGTIQYPATPTRELKGDREDR